MMGKGRLSATNLAVHQHLSCDLFLHNIYHGSHHLAYSDATHTDNRQPSELSKAQFDRGNRWESTLFQWLDREGLLLTVFSGPLDGHDIREIVDIDERPHFFVAGLHFWPPNDALREEFKKAGTSPVDFSLAKPDLVEILKGEDGSFCWRVIDAKASKSVQTSHLIQIYFYTLCLQHLLPRPHFHFMNTAAVWLPPPGGFECNDPSFSNLRIVSASHLSDSLKNFIFRQLPHLLSLPRKKVEWHYNPLCGHCPYNPSCRSRAVREGTLGSIPNLSLDDAKSLKSLLEISRGNGNQPRSHELTEIEELHKLLQDQGSVATLQKAMPSTMKKAKRILGIPTKNAERTHRSAVVEAVITQSIKVIHRRSFTCPRAEDIAVILSITQDPATLDIASFCISVFSTIPSLNSYDICGHREELVPWLSSVIEDILNLHSAVGSAPRTQFYVFSSSEQVALQGHIIEAALTADLANQQTQAAIRLCIGALCEGSNLLSTLFQPLILSGAMLDFTRKGRTKADLQMCLERLGLLTTGTVDQLRLRLQDKIEQLKAEGGRSMTKGSCDEDKRTELGQLPRVVVVKKQVESLLALPIPGYWDLPECALALLPKSPRCLGDEDIFHQYKHGPRGQVESSLAQRNRCIFNVVKDLRRRVSSHSTGRPDLLVNQARVLSVKFMDICKVDCLRKLFFMQQFEVLAKLKELWKSRIEGSPETPILEYQYTEKGTSGMLVRWFRLVSGRVNMPAEKDRTFYDYLLTEDLDDGDQSNLPVEALFDDLSVSGLVFPLNKYTKGKWDNQHPTVQQTLLVADLHDIISKGQETQISLRTWGGQDVRITVGSRYRLSPRLVDFNMTKVLSTILELDLRCDPGINGGARREGVPFLQLILDPHTFGRKGENSAEVMKIAASVQHLFREQHSLGSEAAGALVLKASQLKAANRILTSRLAVIWGPPGTGKTYTIALSLLRLLDVQRRLDGAKCHIIFLTAMTHAAIQACLDKLVYLMECYHRIDGLSVAWLDRIKVEHVIQGNDHPPPAINRQQAYIYAGTVYQLYNFSKQRSFEVDCVFIDEAGQLTLGSVALVLRSLNATGRVVISGDSEQLPPILLAQYPQLKRPLFGSILDCLMAAREVVEPPSPSSLSEEFGSQSTIVQLTENFRLNRDLGDFVATIYSRAFEPQKAQTQQIATRLRSIRNNIDQNDVSDKSILKNAQLFLLALSDVMLGKPQTMLKTPSHKIPSRKNDREALITEIPGLLPQQISLALVRLKTRSTHAEQIAYESYVRGEAAVAAALVKTIRACSPEDDIFVVTPHRIQRQAVKETLGFHGRRGQDEDLTDAMGRMSLSTTLDKVRVDTVERLQGSEAAFVICLFSHSSSAEVGFLLERRRLNVAISRAKTLCILVSSDEVLRPSVKVLANEECAKGYTFLRAFEDRAWSATIDVDLDHFQ